MVVEISICQLSVTTDYTTACIVILSAAVGASFTLSFHTVLTVPPYAGALTSCALHLSAVSLLAVSLTLSTPQAVKASHAEDSC